MKAQPLVSIALCTYNGGEYLSEQLNTLVNQTYKKIEIIAVDDCSTDDTLEILENFANRYANIRLHKNVHNLGFASNFQKAISLCNGDLIALCDQDDIWDLNKINLQVSAIGGNILIYHDSEFVHQDGTTMHRKMSDLMNLYSGNKPETFLFFNSVSGHSILMKKELLDFALPMKKKYFHDWWLAYVATNVGRIDFIPQCLVKYRQHKQSETNILGLARKNDNYKFSSAVKINRQHQWLGYCASFSENRNPNLITQFYEASAKRLVSYISFELVLLILQHFDTIFYIRKKNLPSKVNYAFQQMFGIKTKGLLNKQDEARR